MKKTLNINLGGMAFVIDESAFTLLHNYLEALKRKFNNEQEREEIINDIEARIAEMLNEKLGTRKEVLSEQDVEYVIGLMGKPEDIAGDEPTAETTNAGATQQNTTTSGTYSTPQGPVKKRLFRDPDDAKIGGVISGLCHYFGINDPAWVRIAALVLIPITSGSIIMLYLILLIVVPKAYTSAEKLQMKGEPVNIDNIKREVQDAAGRFTDTVTGLNSDGFFQKLGKIVVELAKAFGKIVAVFMILVAFGGLATVLLGFGTFLIFGTTPLSGVTHLLVNNSTTVTLFSIGFLLFCAAPLIGIIYTSFKIVLGSTARVRWLKWALLGMWLTGLVLLLFTGYETVINFKDSSTVKDDYVLMQPSGNTLYVQLADSTANGWVDVKTADNSDDEDDDENNFTVVVNGRNLNDINRYKIGKPGLQLTTSDNDSFYVSKIVTSRGSSRGNAIKNAQLVLYSFSQTDSVLKLSDRIELAKDQGKWRAQNVKIRIAVPKGKQIKFAGNIDEISAIVKGDNSYDDTYFANTTWTNEDGKIKCLTCTGSVTKADEEDIDTDNTDTITDTDKLKQKVDEKVKRLEQRVDELNKKVENSSNDKDQSHEDF